MITYQRSPLIRARAYYFERSLDENSEIFVRVGEIVQPETIVARGWQKSGFRTFDLAALFGVRSSDLKDVLCKTIGSKVYKGDMIARYKEWFGLKEKIFRSPATGYLVDYKPDAARLTLQYLPTEIKIASGVFGKVMEVLPEEHVKIGTKVDIVYGVIAFGSQREGSLVEVGYSDIPLQPDQIDTRHVGKIIFGGTRITADVLYKALSLGVKAVVAGGINYEDFIRLYGSKGRFEDIGISLLITEGFGPLSIYTPVYEFLKNNEHRHVSFLPKINAIVVPLSSEAITEKELADLSQEEEQLTKSYNLVEENRKVRLINDNKFGVYGIVNKILKDQDLVEVVTPKETLLVPPTDIELIVDG